MEAKLDGSLCLDPVEARELRHIVTRMNTMLDEIPAMAAPSIKHRDIELISAWHEKLKAPKQKREKKLQ